MKKIVACLFLVSVVFVPLVARANPPSEIDIVYDQKEKMLGIDVLHQTGDRRKHYIRRIEVSTEDEVVYKTNFLRQDKNDGVALEIPVDAKDQQRYTVKVYCEKGGTKEKAFIVSQNKEETK